MPDDSNSPINPQAPDVAGPLPNEPIQPTPQPTAQPQPTPQPQPQPMAQPDYTDPADGQNAKAEQVVDTIVNVADKFRRIRIIGSIISFVVVLVVMAVFLLNT
ncbi:hypothetical protein J6X15_02000, partial [Candidatus Saccharibacteria bacterium]|nr:hypothetical protein [Candidatus Saccharibacteria bacterium]